MEFNENLPIYVQIMDLLKSKISSGELNMGSQLPSVREMSKKMKVNPNTIQRTYQELERENLVFTQRGMGTFITKDIELIESLKYSTARELMMNYIKDMRSLGYENENIIEMLKDFINKEVVEDEDSEDRKPS